MPKKDKAKPAPEASGNTVNKDLLMSALSRVQPGLAKKDVLPQSNAFVFKDGQVITFNDEISVRVPFKVPFTGAVEAAAFYGLLSKCKESEMAVEVTEGELKVTAGRMRAGFPLQAEIELPIDEVCAPEKWVPMPEGFFDAVKLTVFAASKDMARPILTCINVAGAQIEASDGFRFSRHTLGSKAETPFAIPADAAKTMAKYEPTKYGVVKGWAHFKNGDGVVFSCRAFEDSFPSEALTRIAAGIKGPTLRFPKQLKNIMDRAVIFAESEFKTDPYVTVVFKEGKASVSAKGPHGWFRESCKSNHTGEFSFEIQPVFLNEVMDLRAEVTVSERHLRFVSGGFTHVVCLTTSGGDGG